MKFVLNSNYDNFGCRLWIHESADLLRSRGYSATVNDWDNYDKYDVVIFMSADSRIEQARKQNPDILIGLADPKLPGHLADALKADFLIVSSLEQRDLLCEYHSNIFIYYPMPKTKRIEKKHVHKKKVIIGYQGNKIHLHTFYPHITTALEEVGREYDIEVWALYDIKNLGEWKVGIPDKNLVKTRHIQWSQENIYKYLAETDIGIVPGLMPVKNAPRLRRKASFSSIVFLEDKCDYMLRFKHSCNPGRFYVFSQLNIPLISDYFPSASQFIRDNYEYDRGGFIAYSSGGWYYALKRLVMDHNLRQRCADNLYETFSKHANPEIIIDNFIQYSQDLLDKKKNGSLEIKPKATFEKRSETALRLAIIKEFYDVYKAKILRKLGAKQ